MRFGSLFAGIGGFDLGLERAGMTCAWQVEIDDYCRRVLAKHWPHVERFDDVRECGKHNLQSVDLICGGFPCQPFSTAGHRRGEEDHRHLWPEMLRVIRELRPRWVFGENVAGLISMGLDSVLADMESEGYTWEAFVIPACAVNAPHRRDRVWIVANSESERNHRRQRLAGNAERQGKERGDRTIGSRTNCGRGNVANANAKRLSKPEPESSEARTSRTSVRARATGKDWWAVEPDVGRVAHGVPHRVDRLRALGNAVVPQVVELIGRAILAADAA